MKEYDAKNIVKTYYSILILDACNDIYEEMFKDVFGSEFTSMKQCVYEIIKMKQHDKELGEEFGTWDYRIAKHEEDDDSDWQTIYKLYRYDGKWKVKVDEYF